MSGGVYTTSDYIFGTSTFDGGLVANSAHDLTTTAFSITDQHQTISTWVGPDQFKLWTDGAGNIVNWLINFYGAGAAYITSINVPVGGCPQDAALLSNGGPCAFNGAGCGGAYVPGTWVVKTVDTGPGPTVPEPGTLALLGLGLAGLGLSRRRNAA